MVVTKMSRDSKLHLTPVVGNYIRMRLHAKSALRRDPQTYPDIVRGGMCSHKWCPGGSNEFLS